MSPAPIDTLKPRLAAVRGTLADLGLEALVVTSLPNVLYLTNFSGSAGIAVVTAEQVSFITDFRYVTALDEMRTGGHLCPDLAVVLVDGSYDETLARTLAGIGGRIGFEAHDLTVSRHGWLNSRLAPGGACELVSTTGVVERRRVRKDAYEVATLREAARRLSVVTGDVFGEIRAGRAEDEVAFAIDSRIRRAGFSKVAFETIVAGGPNAALPHARPGQRRFVEGDLVVLDFGGVYDSYCVDLTRTVSVGRAPARAREAHGAVREAHAAAIQAVGPGRSRFDIDAAARATLALYGLAEVFGHGTGHGLGLEVHEDPRIGRRRVDEPPGDDAVEPGMVFTIEPGAYLPGFGGVRIEDDVLVTASGVEVLTDVTTELLEI